MKKIYLSFLVIIFIFSCKKLSFLYKGEADAQVNGESWEGTADAFVRSKTDNQHFGLVITKKNQEKPDVIAIIYIDKISDRQRVHNLTLGFQKDSSYLGAVYSTREEYDTIGDEYDIVDSDTANNWLEITEQKKDYTEKIRGKFSITLYRTKTYPGSPNPDTLRIRDGNFYVSYLKDKD